MSIKLYLPINAQDMLGEQAVKDRKLAFDEHAKEEVPTLRNINALLANEYFNYGWDDAISKYCKKPITDKTFKFTTTSIYIASSMALEGTAEQKEEARAFFTQLLNSI